MQAQPQNQTKYQYKAPVSMHDYFHQKKLSVPDVIGIAGTCTMVFNHPVKCKGRGIRPWEKASYENYDRRKKQEKYFEDQRAIQKYKNQKTVDAYKEAQRLRKEREQKEKEEIIKYMNEQEKMDRVVVEPVGEVDEGECNDAW